MKIGTDSECNQKYINDLDTGNEKKMSDGVYWQQLSTITHQL